MFDDYSQQGSIFQTLSTFKIAEEKSSLCFRIILEEHTTDQDHADTIIHILSLLSYYLLPTYITHYHPLLDMHTL